MFRETQQIFWEEKPMIGNRNLQNILPFFFLCSLTTVGDVGNNKKQAMFVALENFFKSPKTSKMAKKVDCFVKKSYFSRPNIFVRQKKGFFDKN